MTTLGLNVKSLAVNPLMPLRLTSSSIFARFIWYFTVQLGSVNTHRAMAFASLVISIAQFRLKFKGED